MKLIFNYPPVYFPVPRPTDSDNYCQGYFDVRWNCVLFIIWYGKYGTLSTVQRASTQYFWVNAYEIFFRRISYLFVSCFWNHIAVCRMQHWWSDSDTGDFSSPNPTLQLDVAIPHECPWAADSPWASQDTPHRCTAVLLAAVCNWLSADKSRPHFDRHRTMNDPQLVIRQAISLPRHLFILHSPSAIPGPIITADNAPRQGINRSGRTHRTPFCVSL